MHRLILKNARRALCGHYGPAAAAVGLQAGVLLLLVSASRAFASFAGLPNFPLSPMHAGMFLLLTVTFVILVLPLHLGVLAWFYALSDGDARDFSSVFDFFTSPSRLMRAIALQVGVALRVAFVLFLSQLPAFGLAYALGFFSKRLMLQTGFFPSAGMALAVILGLLGLLGCGVWCMRYVTASYLMANNPNITVRAALQKSARIAKGNKSALFMLELSLTGWRLLSLLGIPALVCIPLVRTGRALAVRVLLARAEESMPGFPAQPD